MNKNRQLFKIYPTLTGIRATPCMLQCLFRAMRIGSVQDKQQQSSSEPLVTPVPGMTHPGKLIENIDTFTPLEKIFTHLYPVLVPRAGWVKLNFAPMIPLRCRMYMTRPPVITLLVIHQRAKVNCFLASQIPS